ncbi:MAG: hypothetical protein QOI38_1367 [Sphingomonadales bacterium]|jgi:hypothetical protein|nr:hypothetical protein [Sphingomonadales bacterium]
MLSAALALLLAAQTPSAAASRNPIVVTAQRVDRQAVHRYVSEVSQTVNGQLARLRHPVCPEVLGMPLVPGARIVARIREVAAEAGLRVGAMGCRPNVSVFFVENGDSFVRDLRRRDASIFAGVSPADLRRVLADGEPARTWRLTQTENEDGVVEGMRGVHRVAVRGGAFSTVRSSSVVNLSARQVVTNAVVVIERDAAIGKTLTQLADYAAMVALAGARPPAAAAPPADTILSLFNAAAPAPARLTRLDFEYLAAVYRLPADRRATHQMAQMSERIAAALRIDQRD